MDENTSKPIPPRIDFFQALTDLLPEAFLLLETGGRILAANRTATALFGQSDLRDAAIGALVADPPGKIEAVLRLWSETGSLTPASLTLPDKSVVRADGARIAAQPPRLMVRCVPRSEARATRELVRHSLDYMSFQKNIAERLAEARQQKETAETTTAMFAHEVANPLNGISTALDVLELELEGTASAPVAMDTVKAAKGEIARLASLLNDFRSFARPQLLSLQPVDLAQVVDEILAAETAAAAASGVRIETVFEPALPRVPADRNRLKQAIYNLYKNAVEAMPAGGRLILSGRRQDSTVSLEITDSGTGIPAGLDPFQVFKTTKAQGTGLGLPIAAQIVSLHKGRIEYRSRPEGGTSFVVHLPLARAVRS